MTSNVNKLVELKLLEKRSGRSGSGSGESLGLEFAPSTEIITFTFVKGTLKTSLQPPSDQSFHDLVKKLKKDYPSYFKFKSSEKAAFLEGKSDFRFIFTQSGIHLSREIISSDRQKYTCGYVFAMSECSNVEVTIALMPNECRSSDEDVDFESVGSALV